MDDTQRIVKCGNLSLHTPGGFFKKRWHGRYLVLYDGSKSGVKRLELFESELKFKKQSPVTIIALVDCVRIVTCQRHKTTFTFEVRTSDQFYLLASKSFQEMNDWVNCLRLVAFGQAQSAGGGGPLTTAPGKRPAGANGPNHIEPVDALLLERRPQQTGQSQQVSALSCGGGGGGGGGDKQALTASQAAVAAASALARTRQRQPSLLGSCKPQPPDDSPFIASSGAASQAESMSAGGAGAGEQEAAPPGGQADTLTPTVRGQLICTGKLKPAPPGGRLVNQGKQNIIKQAQLQSQPQPQRRPLQLEPTLDEEEENMLYCSIEDNPSEHNYRVKVIETELALRCQLKCYQLTAPKTISQQYEELAQFRASAANQADDQAEGRRQAAPVVTFYQLIIGPQELTLLNDYAATAAGLPAAKPANTKQGLWSWPYQCIRRYGFDKDNCFMFEAGRKCTSGPGQFIVQTPKAYNIYQDVVKFVNELRMLSGGGNGGGGGGFGSGAAVGLAAGAGLATATAACGQLADAASTTAARRAVVTQIPVAWTPGGSHGGPTSAPAEAPAECRKQFFSQLSRQMDGCLATSPTVKSATDSSMGASGGAGAPDCPLARPDTCHATTAAAAASEFRAQQQKEVPREAIATTTATTTTSVDAQVAPIASGPSESLRSTSHDHNARARRANSGDELKAATQPIAKGAGQKQKRQLAGSASSRLSSGSDETDESGYDQGDESVESGAGLAKERPHDSAESKTAASRLASRNNNNNNNINNNGEGKLSLHPASSFSNSLASSASPTSSSASSSAANSPGQSVSRRTGETIQQEAGNQFLVDARLSLSRVSSGGGASSEPPNTTTNATIARGQANPVANKARGIIQGLMLAGNSSTLDFETSLIRDVYSEITKLHAKFAVTSSGSGGDDSMSSDSRESSVAVSEQVSNGETNVVVDDDDDDDHDDDDESNCADDGCYYLNEDSISDDQEEEPMYSNLRPVGRIESSNKQQQQRQHLQRARGATNQSQSQTISAIDRPHTSSVEAMNKQQQFHRLAQQQSAPMLDHANPGSMMSYCRSEPALLPQSARPIYPFILNPIPEINELAATSALAPNLPPRQIASRQNDISPGESLPSKSLNVANPTPKSNDRRNLAPRTRLAKNRDDIKRQQPSGQQLTNNINNNNHYNNRQLRDGVDRSRPTNHYVINDVQYAKISRNLAAPKLR